MYFEWDEDENAPLVYWHNPYWQDTYNDEFDSGFRNADRLGSDYISRTTLTMKQRAAVLTDILYSTIAAPIHICSLRLMEFLALREPQIEFLAIDLYDEDRTERIDTYYVAHFLTHLHCTDASRSYFEIEEDGIRERIVLRKRAVGGHRVFAVHRDGPWFVAVREDLKEELESAGMTGCVFEPLESR